MTRDPLALGLASAFLAGRWTMRRLVQRGSATLGERPDWLRPVARRVLEAFPRAPLDRHATLASFIALQPAVALAGYASGPRVRIRQILPFTPEMGRRRWAVPELATLGALIDWLGLTAADLAWFADVRGWERASSEDAIRHYRYRWVRKASGGLRLIEAPKPRLRAVQRKILHDLLDRIPVHPAAAAFRPGGSVLAFAAPHAGQRLVLAMDLEDFFASVSVARVRAVFETAGYPQSVARVLAALCTNSTPRAVFQGAPAPPPARLQAHWRLGRRLACPHLPQGAPTSPALANLCAYRLDARLSGVARALGAAYTRYADDLALSGGDAFARRDRAARFLVRRAVVDEGFVLREDKTRAMSQAVPQRLAALVVNRAPNLPRAERERLEAVLTNCVRHGPSTQNREGAPDFRAHLLGRLGWLQMIRPEHAARLRAIFDRIDWGR